MLHIRCLPSSRVYAANPMSRAMRRPGESKKTVHLLRHGQTEMNVYLEDHEPGFEDPLMYDTKLTAKGMQQAKDAIQEAAGLTPAPEAIIASPLTRALQTADLTFPDFKGPRLACGLARERTYFASDVGIERSELKRLWPHWDFSGVEAGPWWLSHTDLKDDPKRVVEEPKDQFQHRMQQLKDHLASRTEACMVLVVHRDVIESLVGGQSPANCEFATIELS